ncbi:MAG: O-methyltransferase [Pyrinomonas sp.]|uniref:O-methyltransferase n=1 Tax=Pyrinomonas sp. TaxID=2080306 RepID=UPI00332BD398
MHVKGSIDAILQREQAEYLETLLPPSAPLLQEMEDLAAQHRIPIADREVALFIEIAARAAGARRALEIGMAIGYSTVIMAQAMGEGSSVVAIEAKDEMIERATHFFHRAGVESRIQIARGRALEVLPGMEPESFDLVFIDANKREYEAYLDHTLRLLRSGGVVIVDNLLWRGLIAQGAQDEETEALRRFNQRFVTDGQMRALVLPLGDGLGYGVKL